jgi:phosphoglycerate kinase
MKIPTPSLKEMGEVRGRRVLVRLDLNVPMKDGIVVDDFRIARSLPTLRFLKDAGAKTLVISHRSHGGDDGSLKGVAEYMGMEFVPYAFESNQAEEERVRHLITSAPEGSIFIFENLRKSQGEEDNDPVFAARIASFGDAYVNEAFSASHRAHASIVSVPRFLPHYAGLLFEEEIKRLGAVFNPTRPFIIVLGGAKFSTKLPLVRKFLPLADKIFICGALAHTFFRAQGFEIGKSLIEGEESDIAGLLGNEKIILPEDVRIQGGLVRESREVGPDDTILDAGPATEAVLRSCIEDAGLVLWNGPLGRFEKGFDTATVNFARSLAQSRAETIIGGGDTLAAIAKLNILKKFGFVSTAGGAMLEFLANGTLTGIEALKG